MQASPKHAPNSRSPQPSTLSSIAGTPTPASPLSMQYNLSQHSPSSPYIATPGPTPALSVSTGTSVTGSPTTTRFQDSDGVN